MAGTASPFDISGGGDAPTPSTYPCDVVLTAGTAKSIAVPTVNGKKAQLVLFSRSADFYAAYSMVGGSANTAVVPASDITDGTGVEINPTQRNVSSVASISLIAPAACIVGLAFFF